MSSREFDVVVLGAGPAGEVLAGRLGEEGVSVALVECELVGGECSFYACMPSKALLRPGELLLEARRVPGADEVTGERPDVDATLRRRDEVIHDLDDSGQLPWLEKRSIELVRGRGRLDGERRVRVGDELLEARRAVVIATGSEPALPPVEGLDGIDPWTNREATTARAVPGRLLILGGGPVGLELAQAWRSLGSDVTVVEAADTLLPREEPFAGELIGEGLRQLGVEFLLGAKAQRVARSGSAVKLALADRTELEADELLVATGRRPRTRDLGLDSIGIDEDAPLEVDGALRAGGLDWLYAVGDVNGRNPLTHTGKYQARVVADLLLGRTAAALADQRQAPRMIFTEPQLAAVGATFAGAREEGLGAEAVDVALDGNAGASFHGRNDGGRVRFVIDPERRVLVGATFVGTETAELLHAATIAIVGQVPLEALRHAIPAFPTRNEVWLELGRV